MITYLSNFTTYHSVYQRDGGIPQRRNNWTIDTVCSMQWTGRIWRLPSQEFTRLLKQIPCRFIKCMIDMMNTGKQKHIFAESTNTTPTVSDQCHCCKQDIETTLHVYKYNNMDIKKFFTVSIKLLFQGLCNCNNKIPTVWMYG